MHCQHPHTQIQCTVSSHSPSRASDPGLKEGVNTYAGKLTYEAVADDQGLEYAPLDDMLGVAKSDASAGKSG